MGEQLVEASEIFRFLGRLDGEVQVANFGLSLLTVCKTLSKCPRQPRICMSHQPRCWDWSFYLSSWAYWVLSLSMSLWRWGRVCYESAWLDVSLIKRFNGPSRGWSFEWRLDRSRLQQVHGVRHRRPAKKTFKNGYMAWRPFFCSSLTERAIIIHSKLNLPFSHDRLNWPR